MLFVQNAQLYSEFFGDIADRQTTLHTVNYL
jgi:hypothetical protein